MNTVGKPRWRSHSACFSTGTANSEVEADHTGHNDDSTLHCPPQGHVRGCVYIFEQALPPFHDPFIKRKERTATRRN